MEAMLYSERPKFNRNSWYQSFEKLIKAKRLIYFGNIECPILPMVSQNNWKTKSVFESKLTVQEHD